MTPLFAFSLYGLLADLIAKLAAIIQSVFNAVWSVELGFLQSAFAGVAAVMPGPAGGAHAYLNQFGSQVTNCLSFANNWVALDVGSVLIGIYIALWIGLEIYRFVKSWIPTLTG